MSLGNYTKALSDAEDAIRLSPTGKCYLAKGIALIELKRYPEAEHAINTAKQLSPGIEYDRGLVDIRNLALKDLGFSDAVAKQCAKNSKNIEEAIELAVDNHPASQDDEVVSNCRNEGNQQHQTNGLDSDNDDEVLQITSITRGISLKNTRASIGYGRNQRLTSSIPRSYSSQSLALSDNGSFRSFVTTGGTRRRRDVFIPDEDRIVPENVVGYKAIWIGNIDNDMDEYDLRSALRNIFLQYGHITRVTVCRRRGTSAFVDYSNTSSPCNAIFHHHAKYNEDISADDRRLVIRFACGSRQRFEADQRRRDWNSDECYFWRTTGCDTNIRRCHSLHNVMCKGIDYQPRLDNEIMY